MTGGWGELLNRANRLTGKMDLLIPPGSKCLFKQSLATRVGQVPIGQVSSRSRCQLTGSEKNCLPGREIFSKENPVEFDFAQTVVLQSRRWDFKEIEQLIKSA